MARRDPRNTSSFWTAPDLGDVELLRADFQTHRFERHVHDELVIAVTERGAGRFTSRGTGDIASAHAVGVFNPGEPHEGGVFDTIDGWSYRAIYLGPRALQQLGEAVVGQRGLVPYMRRNAVPDQRLARLVLAAHRALETSRSQLARETCLLEAYAHLVGEHADTPRLPVVMTPARARVGRALDMMHDRLAENLSVDDLALAAALSPYHFIRTFRREMGMPPHAYLTQIRLRHARSVLAAGVAPVDAALAAGFSDQSHLTKHFKRSYGITPAQYAAALQ
jgi:AraC-like DNA-binding protein